MTSTSDTSDTKGILKVHHTVHLTTALLSPCCLDLHWCRGVCDGGTLSREGLPGFGSTSLQRPEILGSGQPGFQSDLNNMHNVHKVALIYQCKLCAPSHGMCDIHLLQGSSLFKQVNEA